MPLEMTATLPVGAQLAKLRQFESVRDVFVGPIVSIGLELPMVILLTIALFLIGGPLALVPICIAGLFVALAAATLPGLRRASVAAARIASERQNLLLDTFAQMREIRTNGCAGPWLRRLDTVMAQSAAAQRDVSFRTAALMSTVGAAGPLAGVATIAVGAVRAMDGAMTIGALVASMLVVWRVLAPLQQLFATSIRYSEIAQSFRQLDMFMHMKGEPRQSPPMLARPDSLGELRFVDVTFRYPGAHELALQGVTFTAQPGEMVAVTGDASSGRTTLVRLALALHRPQHGAVLLDGLNLRQHDPRTQRAAIGYVPQSPVLFRGTIMENLRLAAPGATREEIAIACGRTRILKAILAMPEGFDTPIAALKRERLSASFRQSFALAQALLRQPKVLVLDEPGAAFDVAAEDAFTEQLESLRGVATILLVTRRLRHAAIADSILVLNRGRMAAFGPAEAVLRQLRKAGRDAA